MIAYIHVEKIINNGAKTKANSISSPIMWSVVALDYNDD